MMHSRFPLVLGLGILVGFAASATADAKVEPRWESIDRRPTPPWFQDAKFGIFIHWGVYSVPAFGPGTDVGIYARYAEWYWKRLLTPDMEGHAQFKAFHDRVYGPAFRYPDFVSGFKAEMFDPGAWADVFERSGAKYVVLTSKHHEGFCLWPSPQSFNWNAVDVGPHRDLAGDLTRAVREKGLKMGFYYSLYEWFNPLYLQDVDGYVAGHMLPQMKDLVTRYAPDVLWTDGEWDHPSARWRSEEFLSWLFNDSPVASSVAVNDRWGKETRGAHGGYYTTEYGLVHDKAASAEVAQHPWEECRGIGHSFGYNRAETVTDYAKPEALVRLLVNTVSRGGNLLLDIGPSADGRIPVIMEERLLQMGDWLKTNGEAIYGTRPWRAQGEGEDVRYTAKGDAVYAVVFGRPGEGVTLKMPRATPAARVTLLGSPTPPTWKAVGEGVKVQLPPAAIAATAGSYARVFKLTGVK